MRLRSILIREGGDVKLIKYLAIPYSHLNKEVERLRFEIANAISAFLMKNKEEVVFSPISHSHPMVQYGVPTSWEWWGDQDRKFLDVCGELYVTLLKGYETSTGVNAEVKHMVEKGIKVTFLDPLELGVPLITEMVVEHDLLVG